MKKNKVLKMLQDKEDKLLTALEDLVDFLDLTEDPHLSELGRELSDQIIDIVQCHDTYSINEMRSIVEQEWE